MITTPNRTSRRPLDRVVQKRNFENRLLQNDTKLQMNPEESSDHAGSIKFDQLCYPFFLFLSEFGILDEDGHLENKVHFCGIRNQPTARIVSQLRGEG